MDFKTIKSTLLLNIRRPESFHQIKINMNQIYSYYKKEIINTYIYGNELTRIVSTEIGNPDNNPEYLLT